MQLNITGPQRPRGKVSVSGAKNSATRVLAAALVSDGTVTLRNFPLELEDTKTKIRFAQSMGAKFAQRPECSELVISVPDLSFTDISDFYLPIRTTYLLAAGTLIRHGIAKIPYPEGCKIGNRGYDLHMMVWQKLGCSVDEKNDHILVTGRLKGSKVDFPISTVGGTENALICASVAQGETLIRNAYITPEVNDLILFLREMGAHIDIQGRSYIRVQGANGLLRGASFNIMPDRIEALTWIILASVTGGNLLIKNIPFEAMEVPFVHLREAGIDFFANSSTIMIAPDCIGVHGIQPFELATGTYPGVISDMQPFFVFLGLFANGRSTIFDYRYPARIAYAHELEKFAPNAIMAANGRITVNGPATLQGAQTKSTDLRGSMAQIMAAICANGHSCVDGVELALRGYNNLPDMLATLGIESKWEK